MRVLVTGGAGFLGRYVTRQLESGGARVFVPRSRDFDLTHTGDVHRLLSVSEPEVVIHLAARVGGIGANVEHPGSFFYDNAIMGLQLMEQSRRAGVRKFVQVGTGCSYPEHSPVPQREDDLWNGYPAPATAPYAMAKKMLLVQAQVYRAEYGFDAIYVIPTNLYGPGDNFDYRSSHVVPALIRKVGEAVKDGRSEITLWGSGNATRDFIYAADAARGILAATDRYSAPEPVNIGTGQEVPIRDLARMIATQYGWTGTLVWDHTKPDGQPRRCLDTTRAERELDFRASTSLVDGLRETIAWFEDASLAVA